MFELFHWAEQIVKSLLDLGDFLLYKPFVEGAEYFSFFADVLEFWQIGDSLGPSDGLIAFFDMLGQQSIGSLLFGASLTFLLGIKMLKFFIDLIG